MSNQQNSNTELQSVTWQPTPLPLGSTGVDLREGAAGRHPAALRELLNGRFVHDRALSKRAGHTGHRMRTDDPYPQVASEESAPWLYGWGKLSYQAYPGAPSQPPYFPDQTRSGGVAVLDDKLVGWTGDRFLTRRAGNPKWTPSRGVPGYICSGRVRKYPHPGQDNFVDSNIYYDSASSATHLVTAYERSDNLYLTVRDSATEALLVDDSLLHTATNVVNATVVYSSGYFVAIWSDTVNMWFSYASDGDIKNWSTPASWANTSGEFDVEVISDERFLVAWREGVAIKIAYWTGREIDSTPAPGGTILPTGGNVPNGAVAVCVGRDDRIGLLWATAAAAFGGIFNPTGTLVRNDVPVAAYKPIRVAVAGHWNYRGSDDSPCFTGWADVDGLNFRTSSYFWSTSSAIQLRTYYRCLLVTRAFRVGDVAVAGMVMGHLGATNSVQAAFFMVAQPSCADSIPSPRVVGCWLRGEGTMGNVPHVVGVRPKPGQRYGSSDSPTTQLWCFSLVRIPPGIVDIQQAQQAHITLDFLPPLRWVQYGRALYTAGHVVNTFDGLTFNEAGFLEHPEITAVASSGSGGSLVPGAVHQYRVYAISRNASGELARSPARTFTAPAVGGGHNNNVVTFTSVSVTSRAEDNVRFEIYRTSNGGSTFYLLDQPIANTFSSATINYTDGLSDASLITRPVDTHVAPVGQPKELLETAPQGCELICAAKSRIWTAGGSVPVGRIVHSKFREDGEQAGWDDLAGFLDLEATGRRITSLSGMADTLVAFLPDSIHAVQGDGPDNLGRGAFPPAQLAVPGPGAVTHEGTTLCEEGLLFWAEAGPRLLTPGFQVVDISQEVEPLARELTADLTGVVAVPGLREARWYTRDGRALMWDYSARGPLGNRWAVWGPLPAAGVAYYPATGGAVLARPDGWILLEDQSTHLDAGDHYEYAWRTGDVRPGDLLQGWNQFQSFSFAGEYRGPHVLACWVYHDNSPVWRDHFTFDPRLQLAVLPWGGDGARADSEWDVSDSAWIHPDVPSPDGVYRFSRRFVRQTGSTVSLRFSDGGTPGDSLVATEVAFLIGPRGGLARTPPREFGGVEV